MKFFILVLAFALMAQTPMAQLGGYVTLTEDQINATPLIGDLLNLGADYVIQQGVFQSVRAPLPGDWYDVTRVLSVEERVTPGVNFYRYNVILTENDGYASANATYVVSWRPRNAAFLVNSYQYTVTKGNPVEEAIGGPSLIDVRPLNAGRGDLFPILVESIKFVVHDAADAGLLPGGVYTLRYVYNAYLKDSGYPPTYVFLVRLVNSRTGENYRIEITTPVTDEEYENDHEAEYDENEDLGEYEDEVGEVPIGDDLEITYIIYSNA